MAMNIPIVISRIKNEIQALKSFQELSGGQLNNKAASATWQGVIDRSQPIGMYSILAAFEMTFTRTDGINKPPLVDFAFFITPQDTDAIMNLYGNVVANGVNSVVYRITIPSLTWWPFDTTTGTITISGEAYSPVPGNLYIERVYS